MFAIEAAGRQRFRFRGADRIAVPPAPRLTGRATALVAAHPDITPGTIEPDWDGSNLHLYDAVATYLSRWDTEICVADRR